MITQLQAGGMQSLGVSSFLQTRQIFSIALSGTPNAGTTCKCSYGDPSLPTKLYGQGASSILPDLSLQHFVESLGFLLNLFQSVSSQPGYLYWHIGCIAAPLTTRLYPEPTAASLVINALLLSWGRSYTANMTKDILRLWLSLSQAQWLCIRDH